MLRRWGIYSFINLVSLPKMWGPVERWMNLEPVIQSEGSQKVHQTLYINAYIWDLEKWYWCSYLQGKNRDRDIENRPVSTAGEGEGGTNWESGVDIYTLPCEKQIASGKQPHDTGSSAQGSVAIYRGGMRGGGRGAREGGDICILYLIHLVIQQKPT